MMNKKMIFSKTYLFLFFLTLISTTGQSQTLDWAGTFGGVGEDVVLSLHIDDDGNAYTTGYFTDEANFNIADTDYNLTSAGWYDVFIQKTNTDGELLWAKSIGAERFDYGNKLTTDLAGNVYIAGVYEHIVDFDPGVGVFEMDSGETSSIFILKLDQDGNFVWAKSIGGERYEEISAIKIAPSGNLVMIGYLNETIDFDPGPSVYNLTSQGESDTFILTLDSNGHFIYAKSYGGADFDLALDMEISASGELYITGYFRGTADFNVDPNSQHLITEPEFSGYVLHLKEDGRFVSVLNTSGGLVESRGIDIDDDGNAYITGQFAGPVNFDIQGNSTTFVSNNNYNGFVMKVNAAGEFVWAKHIVCDSPYFSFGIAVSPSGHVYTTGYFGGIADFDVSPDTQFELSKISTLPSDAFLLDLDIDGNFVAAFQYGGAASLDTHEIGLDPMGSIYLAAHFEGAVDINPLSDGELNVSPINFRDNYLIKLAPVVTNTSGDLENQESVTVFPNPSSDIVFIKSDRVLSNQPYTIFDTKGSLLISGLISPDHSININQLSTGTYFLKLSTGITLKIVKNK